MMRAVPLSPTWIHGPDDEAHGAGVGDLLKYTSKKQKKKNTTKKKPPRSKKNKKKKTKQKKDRHPTTVAGPTRPGCAGPRHHCAQPLMRCWGSGHNAPGASF